MAYIQEKNYLIPFVIPDYPNVHVDAALKKIRSTLYPFYSQR